MINNALREVSTLILSETCREYVGQNRMNMDVDRQERSAEKAFENYADALSYDEQEALRGIVYDYVTAIRESAFEEGAKFGAKLVNQLLSGREALCCG